MNKKSLDKKTVLTIRDTSYPHRLYYNELLDFDDGEIICLHDNKGISRRYNVKRGKPIFHEFTSFPQSPDCLSRNYDLFPAEN